MFIMNNFNIHEKFKILVRGVLFGAFIFFSGSFGAGVFFKFFGQDYPRELSIVFMVICMLLCLNKWVWSWMSHLNIKIQLIIIIVTVSIGFNAATILGL